MLAVVETHPVQYHAPVYRAVERDFGVPVRVIYGSDFSVAGYKDREFGSTFAWDTDLLSGYASHFLSRAKPGSAPRRPDGALARGVWGALGQARALLLTGYTPPFHLSAALQSRGLPLLLRAETTDHAFARGPLKSAARDLYLKWFYSRCSRLLYVGSRSKAHFERLGSDAKTVFSPYCVDAATFRSAENDRDALREACRRSWGLAPDDMAVLFSGKLSARKGVDLLVEAVKSLPAPVRSRTALLFVGDGDARPALEASCRREPAVKAMFAGFRNQTEMSPYYHAADLLALPSVRAETWGLVVNEALHHGLPCVVSDAVGCAPDLIAAGETGETFASGSVEALAAALRRAMPLTGVPTRARCREKAAAYSVRAAASGIASAYRAVAGEDRRG